MLLTQLCLYKILNTSEEINLMNQKNEIIALLRYEEGVRYTPYIDSLGYPTSGVGFKLGPHGAPLKNYTFTLNDKTIDAWLNNNIERVQAAMIQNHEIAGALSYCSQPREDILTSMAYQMGVGGLGGFHQMLKMITQENWDGAALQMLNSVWARQTPDRARRHAEVMKSGEWQPTYFV